VSDFEQLLESMVPGIGTLDTSSMDAPPFPTHLGLSFKRCIGRGGTGWVYEAEDTSLGRTVAAKISRSDGGTKATEAVLQEARVTAALECPGVLPVHRVIELGEQVCVTFQLAPTTTLADLNIDGLSREQRWTILHSIIQTLGHAHDKDLCHGDIHPRNIAIGTKREVFVMDWGDTKSSNSSFTGHPGYAAPELLNGSSSSPAADLYSWAAVCWEVLFGSPLRSIIQKESVGEAIQRWRTELPPSLPEGMDEELGSLLLKCLSIVPEDRPPIATVDQSLHSVLTGRSERARRMKESIELISHSRTLLDEYRDIAEGLQDEIRVVSIQRTKIPDSAPATQKRPLWDAEDRLGTLMVQQEQTWVKAVEETLQALTLSPENHDAHSLMAELWWLRFKRMEACSATGEIEVSLKRIRQFDDGRYTRLLEGAASVSLQSTEPNTSVRIEGFQEIDRQLRPFLLKETSLPLERHEMDPGSWMFTIQSPGKAPIRYPVSLKRREHHRGTLIAYTEAEIGADWTYIPGGSFQMGGDPIARQVAWKAGGRGPMRTFSSGGDPLAKEAVESCSPTVRDFFMMKTCVSSAEYLNFLQSISADEASIHVPGEAGLYGNFRPYWTREKDRWVLPLDWNPQWPVVAVNIEDVNAFATWISEQTGRPCRLPTEEEWEKAARGVDARAFPWGSSFDPTFAHMRRSRTGVPGLHPVGQYSADCSVYGCMDMAGGVREWTASTFSEGQIVVRGGSWNDDIDELRCAGRRGMPPHFRSSSVGFRLVADSPLPKNE
jgi:formylglycine-generating enzyme required for sulfatase activity